jgi:hypothetical protein
MNSYLENVWRAIKGQKEGSEESFVTAVSDAGLAVAVGIVFVLVLVFLVCFGAARQSWCYNSLYGSSYGAKLFWSFLCFLNPYLYYPFYAVFLNPVCYAKVQQVGGSRK